MASLAGGSEKIGKINSNKKEILMASENVTELDDCTHGGTTMRHLYTYLMDF